MDSHPRPPGALFAVPPLTPDAQAWRAQYEEAVADGSIATKVRPIREQLADVYEELGLSGGEW